MTISNELKQLKWDTYFLNMARFVSTKSSDESTKCGCVIVGPDNQVLSTGYNGLPRGTEYDADKQQRPQKYFYFEHSERNAIYNATRHGIALRNSVAYIMGPPCHDCARALIQSGIRRIVIPTNHPFLRFANSARWCESMKYGKEMIDNASIEYNIIDIG